MPAAPKPADEDRRLAILQQLELLDSPPEEAFDRITRLAARMLQVPIALVTLIDEDRQWFKSCQGLAERQTPRQVSFCGHAILGRELMEIPDATQDSLFRDNPVVTGPPYVRFYAGYPLKSLEGVRLGTLCVIDRVPRRLSATERDTLADLAGLVEEELHAREVGCVARATQNALEAERARREAQFRATFEQAAVGIAHVTPGAHWLRANQRLCELLGYSAEVLQEMDFSNFLGDDDLARVRAAADRMQAGVQSGFQLDLQFHLAGQRRHWFHVTVSMASPKYEEPYFIVVVEDIQARKEAQENLARLNVELEARVAERTAVLNQTNAALQGALNEVKHTRNQLRSLTDNIPGLIAHVGPDMVYRFNNATYGDWFGVRYLHLAGRHMREIWGEREHLDPYVDRVLAGQRVQFETLRDGRHVEISLVPVPEIAGDGYYVLGYDITAQKTAQATMERMAQEDTLTGLPNRRAIMKRVTEAIARQQRHGKPLVLMFLDLDGFKGVNDRHGHDAGDEVLREFARRLTASVRATDTVARLGGDEFTILLEDVTSARHDAVLVADKVANAMQQPIVLEGGESVRLTTSIGIALHLPGEPTKVDELLDRADAAMYVAKRAGKNRYVITDQHGTGEQH
ncbi:bifunctional diguanylate cyclase/phosphodiesterase [Chitinolyticbacter meiyuanensis]|uniref:bifunctional diguanylate cyclase/phosphodiesterase n=1 Tax=Chitinolyticbacter meiyuanensis TaxID=682798 RepID=UPI0016523EF6|nr:diguanylate cyclase [Chitinolyticbacter meiyuanensis]